VWAAVLGSPISHSLSPVLHRAAYAELGLTEWSYDAIECTAEALPELISRAHGDSSFGGYSLTMPLKLAVLPLLDELLPLAHTTGAVNTVVRRDGRLFGANTDVPGMVNALREAGVDRPKRPVVLGGGGSAQAAVVALAQLGAPRVWVALRSPGRAAALRAVAQAAGIRLQVVGFEPGVVDGADLVVSTVPGAASREMADWNVTWREGAVLFDLVYAPWPTPFAASATAAGVRVLGGLELLVHQAVGQVSLMTGLDIDVAILRNAGERALTQR
jgi:shikimate dehydrogenase